MCCHHFYDNVMAMFGRSSISMEPAVEEGGLEKCMWSGRWLCSSIFFLVRFCLDYCVYFSRMGLLLGYWKQVTFVCIVVIENTRKQLQ